MDGAEAVGLITDAAGIATSVGAAVIGLLAVVMGYRFARRAFS